ncbi:MAG: bifunctional diguanylate cyclase/phosphodiesterase, partial [Chloroflexales bacterium]|nr:bifunctional diguanylate cyclase/phosphodiesterase [Chloroflexales bacterium]
LDRFKNINDSLGHPAGDEVLVAIAHRLKERLRISDTIARLGGDEFVVLLEDLQGSEEAAAVAYKLIDLLGEPFTLAGGQEIYAGGSIGISIGPDDADSATRLIRNADTAMYQAKANGGATFQFYTESMTRAVNLRLELEGRLRRALERQEFVLHYQPQIDLATGRTIGVEALIRWYQPEQGLISPAQFIPVAEETGLIGPIGEWVLRSACAQVQAWRDDGHSELTLSVNLSPRQFRQLGLVRMIQAALAESGLPASQLELEITEGAVMEHPEQAIATLQVLREQGVRLAIDDFGTGYSSLSYLQRFALNKLKIDRSFIKELPNKARDASIAATIIAMAHNLGLEVLAEGVESAEQLAWLRAHRCDAAQGYLFSRPLPAEQLLDHLDTASVGQRHWTR